MSHKLNRTILPLVAFVSLVALACTCSGSGIAPVTEAPSGGGGVLAPTEAPSDGGGTLPTAPPSTDAPSDDGPTTSSEFPLPDDATNVIEAGGTLNYQTAMKLPDVMEFYREAFTGQGYTERTLLTVTSDATFSMVFDGHSSGKSIVVQGVDLGGNSNVNLRLEAVP